MKHLALIAATALTLGSTAAFAQSAQGSNVRVAPGHFCSDNKCVEFSDDLSSVSVQSRLAVSVESYGLQSNPVISAEEFSKIFFLALRQSGFQSRGS